MNLYETLGVTPAATSEEIKRAYRTCAKDAHPDVGGSNEEFYNLGTTVEVLSDSDRREKYDRTGEYEEHTVDTKAAVILTLVQQSIMAVFQESIQRDQYVVELDIVKLAVNALINKKQKHNKQISNNSDTLEMLQKIVNRFSFVDETETKDNVLRRYIQSKIMEVENNTAKEEENSEVIEAAIDVLLEYRFDANKPEVQFATNTMNNISTTHYTTSYG